MAFKHLGAIALVLACVHAGGSVSRPMRPENLRCEFRLEPIGIDSARPRFSWNLTEKNLNGSRSQKDYRILVASSATRLQRNEGDLWDSGVVTSREQNNILYAGHDLKSSQKCFWKVAVSDENGKRSWSQPSSFEMGLLGDQDWVAKWINDGKLNPTADADFYKIDPAPLFRKEFNVTKPVKRARLYISGLGYYEASLNGSKVGNHVLDPGWTRFEKRVQYCTYDLTRQIKKGENCIGVELGNGWYNPLPLRLFGTFNLRDQLAVGRPRLIAQLEIDFDDGTSQTLATNESWKVGTSPILRNNIYLGEVVDASREQAGWNQPGFDESAWSPSHAAQEPLGKLVCEAQPPIRITDRWNAVKWSQPKPGVTIYDMGTNFAGWVQLKLSAKSGTTVQLRYGELLDSKGQLNPMTSVAGQIKGHNSATNQSVGGPGAPDIAWQADTYTAKGGGEIYTPKFTFHGFRYVEVSGLDKPLPLSSVVALRLNSDVEPAGTFECSDQLLNNIQAMCRRTFLSNIFSVQSDCPHRERFGYGGDIVATSEAMMMNFDMALFYEKAVRDWSDSVRKDGMLTDTAPFMGIQYCGVVWAMAHPLLLNQLYQYYGDKSIGAEEYSTAKRWLLLVEKQYPDGIVAEGLSDHEALEPAPAPEMVTPLYFQSAKLLATLAQRLGRTEDHDHFDLLANHIRDAYRSRYVNSTTGKVGPGTESSQAFALYTEIVAPEERQKVVAYLVDEIHRKNDHLTTGILGTKFMLTVLSREGYADLALKIATQSDFPSWGWMLKNGATTLWEHWALSDNTYSHNHPMFGSVSQWMINWLGGIQPGSDAVGFDRISIRPQTPVGLGWVKSSYQSVRGRIASSWRRRAGLIEFEVQMPPNTETEIVLPTASAGSVLENGSRLSRDAHVEMGAVRFEVPPGRYVFQIPDSSRRSSMNHEVAPVRK